MEEQKKLIKSIKKWLPFEIENLEEYVGGLYGRYGNRRITFRNDI